MLRVNSPQPWSPWRRTRVQGTLENNSAGYVCSHPKCKRGVALARRCLCCGWTVHLCRKHGDHCDSVGLAAILEHLTTHSAEEWALTGVDDD